MKKIIYFKPPPREEEDSNRALAKEQEELSLLDNKIINDDNISKIELDDINARRSQLMQDMTSMRLESLKQANDPIISEIKAKISNIGGEFTSSNFMSIHADLSDEQAEIIKELDCVLEIKDWEPVEYKKYLRHKIQSSGASTFWRGDEGVVNQYTGKHFNVALIEEECDAYGLYDKNIIFHSQIPAFDNNGDSHGAKVASVIGIDYMYPDGIPCQGVAYEFDTLIVSYPSVYEEEEDMAATLEWLISQTEKPQVINFSGGEGRLISSNEQSHDGQAIDTFVFEIKLPFIQAAGNDWNVTVTGSLEPTLTAADGTFNAIVVGSMNDVKDFNRANHIISDFSTQGPWNYKGVEVKKPDLVAPGEMFNMPFRNDPDGKKANEIDWVLEKGTSYAAPFVAGGCLLLNSAGISDHRQVKAILINSADAYNPIGSKTLWSPLYGWGYLNLKRALMERRHSFVVQIRPGETIKYSIKNMIRNAKVTIVYDKNPLEDVEYVQIWLQNATGVTETSDDIRHNNVKQVYALNSGNKVVNIRNNGNKSFKIAIASTMNIEL